MTDLVITAASVVAGADATREPGTAGEAITAGKALYIHPTTKKFMLADSNSTEEAARKATHIALNSAALNQPVFGHRRGDITIGAALTAGTAYYLSDTPGGICPVADVGTGEYVCLLGLAKSTTVLGFQPQYTGVSL